MSDGWQTAEPKAKKKKNVRNPVTPDRRQMTTPAPRRGGPAPKRPSGGRPRYGLQASGDLGRIPVQKTLGPIDMAKLEATFPASEGRYPFWQLLQYRLHDDCKPGTILPPSVPAYGVEAGVRTQGSHAPTQLVVPKTILKSTEQVSGVSTPPDSRCEIEVWERAAHSPMKRARDASSWLAAQEREKTDDDQVVQRKLRATLNKLTESNYDRLRDKIVSDCGVKSVVHVKTLVELLFEKAVLQQQSAVLYARLVKDTSPALSKLLEDTEAVKENKGKSDRLFRWLVIDRLERNFNASIEAKYVPDESLSEEEQFEAFLKYQEKQTGLLRFVGLLLTYSQLPARCAIGIMEKLVDGKDDQNLEALCRFMESAGARILAGKSAAEYSQFVAATVAPLGRDNEVSTRLRILVQEAVRAHQHTADQI